VRVIWTIYNKLNLKINNPNEVVSNYEEIFTPGKSYAMCIIKIKLIQELIQIDRPRNWTSENLKNICVDLMKIEKYNATITRTIPKFHLKWKQLLNTYKDNIL
jgi:hypothetical protein